MRRSLLLVLGGAFAAHLPTAAGGDAVRFGTDVMAVLSKAGCNQGTCHGNQNGKNGFKLSLRGEDPAFDFAALTRDMLGRRTNVLAPADSLLLRKATAQVPHEGGRRFEAGSPEYDILARWVAGGMPSDPPGAAVLERIEVAPTTRVVVEPADRVQIEVRAHFSNGQVRDVHRLAVYEPLNPVAAVSPAGEATRQRPGEATILVRYLDQQATVQLAFVPARPDFRWQPPPEANYIDRHVFAKLQALRVAPSPVCPDSTFIRRSYLDAIGVLPTCSEARGFLGDSRSDKRARLVDALLERPEFAEFWALKWADVLRAEEKTLDRKGVQALHAWLRQSFQRGKPLNQLARELIAARGSTYAQPPANFYRALRTPDVRAETTAQVFLGIRLQCAKCHNHPFDRWTQADYHRFVAFFARVEYKLIENRRRDRLDEHEFDGEQIVWTARAGEVQHPRTGEMMSPRVLGEPASPSAASGADRLDLLADWVARPDNPFFARAQANRIWYHLMHRGLVEPIDDFRASNPPANASLLDALAQDLSSHGFDLRHLVRAIMTSTTYQLSAVPNETNRDDESNCSHAVVRPLAAEPLLDAISQVTGVPARFNGYPLGLRAGQLPGVQALRRREGTPTDAERFLKVFGKPDRLLACECERSSDTTLGQAFQLISGELIDAMITSAGVRIETQLQAGRDPRDLIAELYLSALCRYPTPAELSAATDYASRSPNRRLALEDIMWGLANRGGVT
jgi:hypothetical protein